MGDSYFKVGNLIKIFLKYLVFRERFFKIIMTNFVSGARWRGYKIRKLRIFNVPTGDVKMCHMPLKSLIM